METISITSRVEISLEDINHALAQHWQVESAGNNRFVIQEGNNRVYVYLDVLEEADKRCRRLLVDYSDIDLVKRVLQVIADAPEVLIDNDFGTVLPGDEFIARIRSEPGWNWRN